MPLVRKVAYDVLSGSFEPKKREWESRGGEKQDREIRVTKADGVTSRKDRCKRRYTNDRHECRATPNYAYPDLFGPERAEKRTLRSYGPRFGQNTSSRSWVSAAR